MEIILNDIESGDLPKRLRKENVLEDYENNCNETLMKISKAMGKGEVFNINFDYGISLYTFNVQLKEPILLKYLPNSYQPIRFFYCLNGSVIQTIESENIQYNLSSYQGSIVACSCLNEQKIKLPAGEDVKLCFIEIDREKYLEKLECEAYDIPDMLKSALLDTKAEKAFFYQGNYSYPISECIKEIEDNAYDGLVRSAFLEAKVHEIFFLQIKQYFDDLISSNGNKVIRKSDFSKIYQAKKIIDTDLKNAPTIKELARKAGTNELKLKKGFKVVFNTTVYNYIRNKRLEMARLLLIEDTLNIGDIANQVGYTNASHFSSRFKEKYGLLPKNYLEKFREKYVEKIK